MTRKLATLADRFNTLWMENGEVHMLNRRKFPLEEEYVTCSDLESVAVAIENMTIQGAPPLAYAAGLALSMHAKQHEGEGEEQFFDTLEKGVDRLMHTRPTGWDIGYVLDGCMKTAHKVYQQNGDVPEAIRAYVYEQIAEGNRIARDTGRYAADLLQDGARVQTICFAGAALCYMLYFAAEDGKDIQLFASETRPYLQGARLTAKSCVEMNIPVTVVTDNMPAYLMQSGKTNVFVSTADKITMDGYIANKIGTYPLAMAAFDNDLPYYLLGYNGPVKGSYGPGSLTIEERNPEEVLHCLGQRTSVDGAKGYYPAFDITSPKYISAVATDRGIFPARLIYRYHDTVYHSLFEK
ncbi:MAG: s-methyl-5-thioribose-1-phosphate isomerase [Clostridia bacterium]|nr:s-methyl-5-thioribose-1-phosphate isomerase [Clostridia bacterium]